MNKPKCDDLDYIHFLIAAQKVFTCTETAKCQPQTEDAPPHDAFTRLLQRQPLDTEALWQQAKALVDLKKDILVLDDTNLDKPYAKKMDFVTYHFMGSIKGWSKGSTFRPCLNRCPCPHPLRLFCLRRPFWWQYEERAFP